MTSSSSNALLSQELFDETVLENEECFDLSPDEALRETIDQFCQQLGVALGGGATNANDAEQSEGARSPTSVAASSSSAVEAGTETTSSEAEAAAVVENVPAALSHLVLSHPNSPEGEQIRADRTHFQNSLNLLDGCVNADGTVNVQNEEIKVMEALAEIGRRCRLGDRNGNNANDGVENENNDNGNSKPQQVLGSPLPYLATFQRTSSIYTLMSFLSVLDPTNLPLGAENNDSKLEILSTTARTILSILTNNPAKDNAKCLHLRGELRDSFVPTLGRLVCLIGGFAKSLASESMSTLMEVLCDLLQLATNATRGCEGAKVSFVQATLPSELNINHSGNTKRGGVSVIIACLSLPTNNNAQLMTETCQLLATLCRYDDFRDPSTNTGAGGAMAGVNTSSAHDHAMEFHRAGAPTLLIKIARDGLSKLSVGTLDELLAADERLAAAVLTALRVLAVNDDIIQTMVALGVLPIVTKALQLAVETAKENEENDGDTENNTGNGNATQRRQRLAASSLGLLRNLCGNDEIKTNLCLSSSSSGTGTDQSSTLSILPHLLKSMQIYPTISVIQEHACGTLAAMSLRRPANARAILNADGQRWILSAMKRHENNVNVQRQGALAVRNAVSRLLRDLPDDATDSTGNSTGEDGERSSIRDAFLELGAENTLRNIAGRHQGSVDEAYAALRDLGCTVSLMKFNVSEDGNATSVKTVGGAGRTMMFGEKNNSNFRPVYEESVGLVDGVDDAINARKFGT